MIGCPKLGFYGESCSIPCPQNCFCHITEGTCLGCLPGYYGENCTLPCPQNCYCNITEGTCLDCLPGYRGLTCEESKWCFNCAVHLGIFHVLFSGCLRCHNNLTFCWKVMTFSVLLIFHTKQFVWICFAFLGVRGFYFKRISVQ